MNETLSTAKAANVLVVDDTPANLQLLAGMLKNHGYRVRPVNNGELALRAARIEPPDLILLDITMPEMNGYEVCRQLKADPQLADIPVLFISALTDTDDKTRAFQAGGVDYVSKPFQFDEVDARVRTHLLLRRQKQALEINLARLRELEKLRDNLAHMIVHDMRSPLLALQLSMDMLHATYANTDDQEVLENARQSVTSLIDMVTQILDVSRMEAGQMQLQRQKTDLSIITKEVFDTVRPLAGKRQLGITLLGSTSASCDASVLRRVISNLVGNALKFTSTEGIIQVTIAEEGPLIRVSVKDNGPGIDPSLHKIIFEKFAQAEGPAKKAGSGLGLTFVKMSVEAHGGQVRLDSEPGKGSTFSFTLPTQ